MFNTTCITYMYCVLLINLNRSNIGHLEFFFFSLLAPTGSSDSRVIAPVLRVMVFYFIYSEFIQQLLIAKKKKINK